MAQVAASMRCCTELAMHACTTIRSPVHCGVLLNLVRCHARVGCSGRAHNASTQLRKRADFTDAHAGNTLNFHDAALCMSLPFSSW